VVEPYWASEDGDVVLHLGKCETVLPGLPANSVDAIVTDPPAAISFMGRAWDGDLGGRAQWVAWLAGCMGAAARVLKWSIPRTSHWTAWALEDAGLEIRDCILHLFGSGFPKSLDVSKAIDRMAGVEREVVGQRDRYRDGGQRVNRGNVNNWGDTATFGTNGVADVTAPATEDAARWEGWGTALKPGQEIWWLARKPLKGTVAANVLEFGTGALNIDGCKVEAAGRPLRINAGKPDPRGDGFGTKFGSTAEGTTDAGRWPANVVFTHSQSCDGVCAADCPVGELDRQSGVLKSGVPGIRGKPHETDAMSGRLGLTGQQETGYGDTGGASRFYPVFRYQAKAPASERPRLEDGTAHETVKPLGFISWAVRLITPPGGTVLDMFGGSGPVPEACIIEGFRCVIIEKDPKSARLIVKRLSKPIQPVMFGLEG
jgi:site-specific DNA-methyltransferase (adenine-specific)